MATIQPFVWMKDRQGSNGDDGFQSLKDNLEFTRVPCVGEFVNIGNDTVGHSADYRVVLVIRGPAPAERVDAEIYLGRVSFPGEIAVEDERLAKPPLMAPNIFYKTPPRSGRLGATSGHRR